jgi:hypothetical protein
MTTPDTRTSHLSPIDDARRTGLVAALLNVDYRPEGRAQCRHTGTVAVSLNGRTVTWADTWSGFDHHPADVLRRALSAAYEVECSTGLDTDWTPSGPDGDAYAVSLATARALHELLGHNLYRFALYG